MYRFDLSSYYFSIYHPGDPAKQSGIDMSKSGPSDTTATAGYEARGSGADDEDKEENRYRRRQRHSDPDR